MRSHHGPHHVVSARRSDGLDINGRDIRLECRDAQRALVAQRPAAELRAGGVACMLSSDAAFVPDDSPRATRRPAVFTAGNIRRRCSGVSVSNTRRMPADLLRGGETACFVKRRRAVAQQNGRAQELRQQQPPEQYQHQAAEQR